MDTQSPPPDNIETKAAFRKPSNDAANRKYRRRSPASSSSSPDGNPKHDHSPSPIYSREGHGKVPENHQRWRDDERELDRDSDRSQFGKTGDSYRHSDRHSSRSSHSHSRRDEYIRRDKHADDEDRNYQRSSYHSGRESRGGHHSNHARQENDHSRSRDYYQDKYDGLGNRSRDKEKETSSLEHQKYKDKDPLYERGSSRRHANSKSEETEKDWHTRARGSREEKIDYHRNSGDRRSDRTHFHDESRVHRFDSVSRTDEGGDNLKEAYRCDSKGLDGQKLAKEEKRKYDDWETKKEERYVKVPGERYGDKNVFVGENQESPTKKPKSLTSDKFTDANEKQPSSLKPAQETGGKLLLGNSNSNDPGFAKDLDAAKVAAMKAAELVNRNLVGVGYMTTDQKKKLLWGSKKSTAAEESGHRWDTALFDDRERQEKFNKLMGVKGDVKMEHKPENQNQSGLLQAEKQKELQLDLEKQYTAGLRRRDGRTVGLGL